MRQFACRTDGFPSVALRGKCLLGEQPRLYFMHFWANDDAVRLAQALGGALSRMNVR